LARAGKPIFLRKLGFSDVGAPSRAIERPAHSAEAKEDLRMEFFPRRCFFRATPLLPGHKLGLEQKKDLKSEGGQG
jgi:hypothetical protein